MVFLSKHLLGEEVRATDGKHFPSKKFKENYVEIFKKIKHIEECKEEVRKLRNKKNES